MVVRVILTEKRSPCVNVTTIAISVVATKDGRILGKIEPRSSRKIFSPDGRSLTIMQSALRELERALSLLTSQHSTC